jgi:N-methylhydantoinase A
VVASADLTAVNALLRGLDAAGRAQMRDEEVPPDAVEVAYTADMRYVGQAYELPVPLPAPLAPKDLAEVQTAFHAVHERVYGYARAGHAVEFVNFRAVHTCHLPKPRVQPADRARGGAADARVAERPVHFAPGGFVPTPIYARPRLPLGVELAGPAIVEQPDTTTVVPPGWRARVEESGNLRVSRIQRG